MTKKPKASRSKAKGKKTDTPPAPAKLDRTKPVQLTDDVLERIAGHVREGNYLETAIAYEGFSTSSLRQMLRNGRAALRAIDEGKDPLQDLDDTQRRRVQRCMRFATLIRQAKARAEVDSIKAIMLAGKDAWQAIAWRLERMDGKKFGKRDVSEHRHGGPDGKGPIPVAALQISPDQFREIIKELPEEEIEVVERVFLKLGARGASGPGDDPGGAGTPSG